MAEEQPAPAKPVEPEQPEENPIEEYSLKKIEQLLDSSQELYYSVDPVWAVREKRKLIDPRSKLTVSIVQNFYEWGLSPNDIIRVTLRPDVIDKYLEDSEKDISHYTNRIHHYLTSIFTTDETSYKPELQGLSRTAAQMLDGVFGKNDIGNITVGPTDVRTFLTYYDHLVNCSVYFLALFALYNRNNKIQGGSVENWRTKNKAEMSRLQGGGVHKVDFAVYYDIYDREMCDEETEKHKKGDLSLVLSGFYAALLHDICFLKEPKIIVSSKGNIDQKLKTHPDLSNEVVKDKLSILADERPLLRNCIKNHHEFIDGTGYPGGKKDKKIHLFSQMLSIVDMYEEFSSRYNRSTVIRYMARGAGRFFDGGLLRTFLSILRPFDIGETINVYEGKNPDPVMRAIILQSNNRFRPGIEITKALTPGHGSLVGKKINLSNDENIVFNI